MQTRDQKFAAAIYEQVTQLTPKSKEAKQYGSMAHKLPVLIHTAGLAQALAFVEARGQGKQKLLLTHLAKVIYGNQTEKNHLLERSRKAEIGEYQELTMKTVAALQWYKRFAQSVLDVEAGDDAPEDDEEENAEVQQ